MYWKVVESIRDAGGEKVSVYVSGFIVRLTIEEVVGVEKEDFS